MPTSAADTVKMMRMSIFWMSLPARGEVMVMVRYSTVM